MRRVAIFMAWMFVSLLPGQIYSQEQPAKEAPSQETLRQAQALQGKIAKLFQEKKYEPAADGCLELIKLLPDYAPAHYDLACAQVHLGKTDDAWTSLTKAVALGFADPELMQRDEDLTALRTDKRFAELVAKAETNRQQQLARLPIDKGAEIKGVKTVEGNPEGGLRYRLRLSPEASPEKPHRLIVWLHPSGGSMNSVVEALAPQFAERGFALLVLTQKQFGGWSEDDAKKLLGKTLPDVARMKELDVQKPVLMGYSAGGQMAFEFWNADPARWGGLILDAAYPVRLENGKYVPRPLPKNEAIKKVPLFVLVGEKDGGAPLWKSLTPAWHEAGVPLTIRQVEGKGHTWLFGKEEVGLLTTWLQEVRAGKLPADAAAK